MINFKKLFKKIKDKYEYSKLERIVFIITDLPKDIYYHIINFPRRIKRALSWFFFMYMNEEWDHWYLTEVIYKKMFDMQRMWADVSRINIVEKERKQILKQITTCLKHLKAFKDDNYCDCKEYKTFEKKWGFPAFTSSPDNPKLSRFERKNVKTEEDKKQESKDFIKVSDLMEKRKQKDIDEFFKLFKEKFQWWWD